MSLALALPAGLTHAAMPAAGTVLQAQAFVTYQSADLPQVETVRSNVTQVIVLPVEALTLSGDSWVARAPGTRTTLAYRLLNQGNVSSTISTAITNSTGCTGYTDTTDIANLKIVLDANGNGIADPAETTGTGFTLAAGQAASLLITGDVPMSNLGGACLQLSASTQLQSLQRTQATFVSIADNPVVQLGKTAQYSRELSPGSADTARYTLTASNIGTRVASMTSKAATTTGGQDITVNGAAMNVVLLRDAIPAGAQYKSGSLTASHANAYKLYRIAADPSYAYRLGDPGELAVEVAVGFPFDLAVGQSVSMGFDVTSLASAGRTLDNVAQIHFGNVAGAEGATAIQSNEAQVPIAGQRLALAHQVVATKVNMASGSPDGTVTYTLALRVRNDGTTPLYNLQLPHQLSGASAFGIYTTATVPATGQYTVVAGSLQLTDRIDSATTVNINSAFTGDGVNTGLLPAGINASVLPIGGEFTLQYQVRVNATGRAGAVIQSQITGTGALHAYASTADATDLSTNGSNPDPDNDGNAGNNSTPTPITLPDVSAYARLAAGLKIIKTAATPLRVSPGTYDLSYTITVRNDSDVDIPYVRVVDNLGCTFNTAESVLNIQSWSLVGTPQVQGPLRVSPAFTGNAPCDSSQQSATDPSVMPQNPQVVLNDSSLSFSKGASAVFTYTVRVVQNNAGKQSVVSNKAWLAAMTDNAINSSNVIAAAATTVASILVDPQGYVYDSVTRQPISGATVKFTRTSCDGGAVSAITPAEIFNGSSSAYTYNSADKSVSMVTGADGQYQFYWNVPPMADICTYSITVTPPAGYSASSLLPAQSSVYNGCSYVVTDSTGIPSGTQSTTWHNQVRTGYRASATPASCEVLHNNIPLDPASLGSSLLLSKLANKSQAEFGDFVDYQLTLQNNSGSEVWSITFDDIVPAGFVYVKGSSMLTTDAGTTRLVDPASSTDSNTRRSSLSYKLGTQTLASKSKLIVRYRLRIGVGAVSDSDAINTAAATAMASTTPLSSNSASARVRVSGGVFSTQGFAVGKVWADCNRNGLQDGEAEPGIPGVRLYMEDGTAVITDQFGRWSLYGLKPVTHALRVDLSTLPAGARLALLDNRQAGQPHSRFLDIKNGELVRADFAVDGCEAPEDLLDTIGKRKEAFAKAVDMQLQALVTARLTTESRIAVVADTRGMPASGMVAGGAVGGAGAIGMAQPMLDNQSLPLINLPAGMAQGLSQVGVAMQPQAAGAPGVTASKPPATPAGQGPTAPDAGAAPSAPAAANVPSVPSAVQSPAPSASLSDSLLGPMASLSSVPLEDVIEKLPPKAAFVELKDKDTVPATQINVRVTGPQQSTLRLVVNGTAVPDNRVGKKSVVTATGLVAYEYIGVRLQPGSNTLRVEALDEFGNVREKSEVRVRAPGDIARVRLQTPERLSADPLRPSRLILQLTDGAGVPITSRTAVTLEAQGAQWVTEDLNPAEPGVQIFVEDGQAEVALQPPAQQGVVHVRITTGRIVHNQALTYLPALTPLQGIGVVEGVLDFSKGGRLPLTQPQAANAFEQELVGVSKESGDGRASARSAFYFKGAIKGEYLLTAAYDSDKAQRDRLFRDIRPDEFYPVYGDGSVRGFDAQSTGKLYVRIDKNRSFVLLGDFNTASSAEVRQLSQYSRALNGVQHRYQDDNVRATSFYAETSATQKVEEIPANGLSFYTLSGLSGDIRVGSEKVEILVRDRSQPQVVISTRSLTRLVDYSFEPLTRRLTLAQPLASYDASFNPQSIRITYELDFGGPSYKVVGTDVQVKASDNVQLGVVAVNDANPANQRKLHAVTALARLSENTAISAEAAQTDTDLKGSGNAGRVTLRHDSGALRAQAQVVKSSTSFDNLSSTIGAGRTEATAQAEYALSEATRLRAEAYHSRDNNNTAVATSERSNVGVAVAHKISDQLVAEVGLRHGNSLGNSAGGFSSSQVSSSASPVSSISSLGGVASTGTQNPATTTTARARITARPESLPRLQLFGEVEQDLSEKDRHAVTAGASYGLTEKTRIYAQHAFVSSLNDLATVNGQNLRNATVVGIDSAYMEGGRLYNEYRATSQAAPQNATGVRNQFKLGDWRLTGGVEHVETVGANPVSSTSTTTVASTTATAWTLGADWGRGPWRLAGAFERRTATTSDASLYSLAGAWRLQDDLTVLARLIDTETRDNTNGGRNLIQRQQIGLAWRPAHADQWNVLSRYEHRLQDVSAGTGAASTDPFGSSVANTTLGRTETHIVSTHANWLIDRQQQLSLRWAGKISRLDDAIAPSRYWAHLLHSRYTRDLSDKWDIGVQAGYLWGQGGANQKTLGLEVGYQLVPSLWLSAGYNLLGLSDPDLSGQNYTSRGAYLRLRWKFDEAVFQFGRVADKQTAPQPAADNTRLQNTSAQAQQP